MLASSRRAVVAAPGHPIFALITAARLATDRASPQIHNFARARLGA